MKRIIPSLVIIAVLLSNMMLMFVFSSCSTTFDGYSYSIEDARNSESFYDEYDYIFTIEQDDRVVDFLVHGDYLRILKFDCKEKNGNMLYQIKSKSTFSISESLAHSETQGENVWLKTSNFPFQVEWRIVTQDVDLLQEGFDFTYNDIKCVLLCRIIENG